MTPVPPEDIDPDEFWCPYCGETWSGDDQICPECGNIGVSGEEAA